MTRDDEPSRLFMIAWVSAILLMLFGCIMWGWIKKGWRI